MLVEVGDPGSTDRGELSTVGGSGTQPTPGLAWFGRFVIEARLGVGGMGEVFRARDGGRPIALKLMRPEIAADPRHRLMFVNEAQLAARLHHRNLVRLHDFGKTNGLLWMALELVEGLPLDRLLGAGPLPPHLAGHVALELLDALAYVHAHGMVHRDVSAANVLVSTAGAIKLSDFGVAKVSTQSLTRANEEKGKPSYMAPEQLREHAPKGPIDGRVDLFAVGVLLHRMTQGEAPFADVGEWLRAGAPLAPTGPLASVIARAMQPDRRTRFADAKSMAAAILRELPATANSDGAAIMAERVRGCAQAAATPMEDFDRLIIAALGAAPAAGGTQSKVQAPVQSAGHWLQPLVATDSSAATELAPSASSFDQLPTKTRTFDEELPTLARDAAAGDADDAAEVFDDEEATTDALRFDRRPVEEQPGESISELICTGPLGVLPGTPPEPRPPSGAPPSLSGAPPSLSGAPPPLPGAPSLSVAPPELPSAPVAIDALQVAAAAPGLLLPAPPQRWRLWLAAAVAFFAALVLTVTLAESRQRALPSPPLAAARPAPVVAPPSPPPSRPATTRQAHRHSAHRSGR